MFKSRQAGVTTLAIDITDTLSQLSDAITKAPQNFFAGMPMVADLEQNPTCSVDQLVALKQQFRDFGLTLIGVTNHHCDRATLAAAELAEVQLGQSNERRMPTTSKPPPTADIPDTMTCSKVIRQHVRSGQRIYAKNRDLIIIGAVGAGAEIIADGHISVYGNLRGRAFAGAKGDRQCFIFCSELSAELVAIAGCYQNMEQLDVHKGQRNCLITLDSDELMSVRSLMP